MINIIPAVRKQTIFDGFYSKKSLENICVYFDEKMVTEGYKIKVTSDKIDVIAADKAGEFYALRTLKQLEKSGEIPCCEIEDYPKFSYRGLMYDVSRNFVGVKFIKHYLDILADVKMNVFHWHLSDDHGFRIDLESYPLLKTAILPDNKTKLPEKYIDESYKRGYFTKDDILEVINYAEKLHITVVPEIDLPGHISAVLNVYPELSCDGKKREIENKAGIFNGIGCIANDDFIKFCTDVVLELCDIFPSKYIHLGGDEVPTDNWKICPKCTALMKSLGINDEEELQTYFENILIKEVVKAGKTPICWNDIINEKIDKNAISHYWTPDYSPEETHVKEMRQELLNGRKYIMSYHSNSYLDMPYVYNSLKQTYDYNPSVTPFLDDISEKISENILGVQCNMWTEYAFDKQRLEYQIFPRLFAFAEMAWGSNNDYDSFKKRLQDFIKSNPEMEIEPADMNYYKDTYTQEERNAIMDEFYTEGQMGMIAYNRYLSETGK